VLHNFCDCLSKYYGRASRDALRGWSCPASTVIHGPRYEPDYGPRYEPDYGPRHASGSRTTPRVRQQGRATHRAAGPRYVQGCRAAGPRYASAALHARQTIASPRRWMLGPTDGRRRYIPLDIEAPRPWSLQPDACTVRWDYVRGSDSVCWSLLYTAGPENLGRVIRLHLLGPTAIIGAGPAGGGRINVGQTGMERVEGGDFSGPSQDGPGPRWGTLWENLWS
jgi:hypothetical protein